MKKLFQKDIFLLIFILLIACIVRLYKIDTPLADWHSWRQSDTSAVSRSFVNNGFDLLHPKFEDLSNVPSGKDNPEGYRFVEFPIYNVAQAGLYKVFGLLTLEEWGRLVTIFSSVLSTLFIYLLVKRHADRTAAVFSSLFFALLPYNIYYGRVILPDPSMVMATLGGIYFFDKSLDKKFQTGRSLLLFFISIFFTAAAFLLKPYALFFTLPMIYLAWKTFGYKFVFRWQLWLFAIITIIPLVLWRLWMTHYPEGIPVSDWLFNGGNIRFKGAFFYWLFADRLGRLILGYWGLALFVFGILVNSGKQVLKKNGFFFFMFLLSSLLYLTVIARGNVQHDYYQILIIPTISIFLGLGARALLFANPDLINPYISKVVLILIFAFMLGFGWYFVRDYYNINNPSIIIAGEAADKLLPKNAKVLAPYDGDTTFLYQTKRSGWASFEKSLPLMVSQLGATHLILVSPSEKDYDIGKEYKIIASSKDYLIFDLRQKP